MTDMTIPGRKRPPISMRNSSSRKKGPLKHVNNALWGQTHYVDQPHSAVNFTAHLGVKRTLG